MKSVFDTRFLFFHVGFGGSSDVNLSDTTGKLGEAFLQFFAIILGGSNIYFITDGTNPAGKNFTVACTIDEDCGIRIDNDSPGLAEVLKLDGLDIESAVLENRVRSGKDGDVTEHGFTAIPVPRGFDCGAIDDSPKLVHDQHSQSFFFDIFGNDKQRPFGLGDHLQQRDDILNIRNLFLMDQDVTIAEFALHGVWVSHEMRREITTVELHSFDDLDIGIDALALFDGNDAIGADFVHGFSEHLADFIVVVRGNGTDI